MKATGLEDIYIYGGIVIASAVWVWRALSIGVKIGELTKQVSSMQAHLIYLQERLDAYIDRQTGGK